MAKGGGRRKATTLLIALLWDVLPLCYCFNLEPSKAHIYQYPYAGTQARDSFFGYAVALQHAEPQGANWVLVGAPRSNSSFYDEKEITEPGSLFKCSLTSEICEELIVDPTGNDFFSYGPGLSYLRYKDLKNNGWLGGSLDSQPNYQSDRQSTCVCAPQWKDQNWKLNSHMNGACYIAIDPITDNGTTTFIKKLPLVHRNKQQRGEFEIYAYGQAGFSVHFPDDATKLVIGMPGVFRWSGSVLLFQNEREENTPTRKKREVITHNQMFTNSDPLEIDGIEASELFGYSVTSGNFMRENKTLYAAGAPRSALSFGKVMIFEFPSYDEKKLVKRKELKGEQMGEYFGAAVTAADVNGDATDDLIVGSPCYSDTHLTIPDMGRIQTFVSTEGSIVRDKSYYGNKVSSARFGTTLASPGDLNSDGFEDIAVGAPWEGNGAVYIFLGSNNGLKEHFSQRLAPQHFTPLNLRGFGMALSRGIDMDANGYPDIAIGSFLSGHALLVKSRPVARLYGRVTSSPPNVQWEDETTLDVQTCIFYKGYRIPDNLNVRATLTLDPDSTFLRTVFADETNTFSFEEHLVLNENNTCRNHQVTVKENKINPDLKIILKLEYELLEDNATDIMERPVTNPDVDNFVTGYVGIVKDCNDKICKIDMKATAEFVEGYEDSGVDSLVVGKGNKLRIQVSNSGETAYLPTVNITADRQLILTPSSSDCTFFDDQTVTSINCILSKALKTTSPPDVIEVEVEMNENYLPNHKGLLELQVNVSGNGFDVEPNDNIINKKLRLAVQADMELRGSSEDEQVPYKLSEDKTSIVTKNAKFNHTFILIKKGPTPLRQINLALDIPVNFTEALNFVKVYGWTTAFSDPYTFHCSLDGIKKAKHTRRSTTSDAAYSSELQGVEAEKKSDGVQYFNCSSQGVECAHLFCAIPDWELKSQSAKVSVELEVDLSFLAKYISINHGAVFASTATATITFLNPQMKLIGEREIKGDVVTYIQPDTLLSSGIPWWVIVLAILGSLLLLGLLAYVLYKKGFFKRQSRDEMKSHRARLGNAQAGALNSGHSAD